MREAQAQQDQELIKLTKKKGVTGKDFEELQQKMAPHDVKVRIDVFANISSESFYDQVNPAPAIAGGLVYRTEGKYRASNGWNEGATYVSLGKTWEMENSGGAYVNFTPDKRLNTSTLVQNLLVKVQVDPKRAGQMIQKIDWEALNKLIKY